MIFKTIIRFLFVMSWITLASAASVSISPTNLDLKNEQQIISFNVVNQSDVSSVFQINTVKWDQRNGSDIETPTSDLIVTPPIIKVPPKTTQIVRLGLRHPINQSAEKTYRVIMQEIPLDHRPEKKTQAGVTVLLRISIPVYVAPLVETKKIDWRAKQISSTKIKVSLVNSSNVHITIRKLLLTDSNGNKITSHKDMIGCVLGGNQTTWLFTLNKPLYNKQVKITADTNWSRDKMEQLIPVN